MIIKEKLIVLLTVIALWVAGTYLDIGLAKLFIVCAIGYYLITTKQFRPCWKWIICLYSDGAMYLLLSCTPNIEDIKKVSLYFDEMIKELEANNIKPEKEYKDL